jgi:hypothetical protein
MKTRSEVLGQEVKLGVDVVNSQIKFLQGRVLTIVEAAISDRNQLKAVKDLINTSFSNQLMYVLQLGYPKTMMMTGDQAANVLEMKEVK